MPGVTGVRAYKERFSPGTFPRSTRLHQLLDLGILTSGEDKFHPSLGENSYLLFHFQGQITLSRSKRPHHAMIKAHGFGLKPRTLSLHNWSYPSN